MQFEFIKSIFVREKNFQKLFNILLLMLSFQHSLKILISITLIKSIKQSFVSTEFAKFNIPPILLLTPANVSGIFA